MKSQSPRRTLVSGMIWRRDSFGMAWVCLSAMSKVRKAANFTVGENTHSCNLSAKKTYLLLDSLPHSVKNLKLGPSTIKRESLSLAHRFLESLSTTEGGVDEGEQEGVKEGEEAGEKEEEEEGLKVGEEEGEGVMRGDSEGQNSREHPTFKVFPDF
uniref:Uncharacterized protein n=1 Tax=Chromera velia CCMP2878 TaxID=1169474 RepID=A0A0G4GQF0_9ALVE|eukprot:Cvel_22914.t1-p1 / transcript=Cvel_22914.t1 / gene=Cvel_22914 / organism=Chromera_velia_CCMP2878 / gene_product=hypothetical protein / transcript_product=hypothetical protein / location=Cvel_scaffold2303:1746-4812(-) / protein_length=155 / sequence_SO=supercontig / SO=protein_coding / is_pseudo=false